MVAVTGVTAAVQVYGAPPGPATRHRAAGPTVYAGYDRANGAGAVIPVSTATNKAGKPIRIGFGRTATTVQIAVTPDGKTAYVLNPEAFTVIPISTATNTAGKPISDRPQPESTARHPSRSPRTARPLYVANTGQHAVVPISTATNTTGKPIPVGSGPQEIAFTPDGKTAYVVSYGTSGAGRGSVTPISTATNTAGKPIRTAIGSLEIVITPDGKTAYAYSGSTLTPIRTATNTAGKPILLHTNFGEGAIAITPDGKTIYALTIHPDTVVPISTATNTAGTPINVHLFPAGIPFTGAEAATQFVMSPDGKTIYLGTGEDSIIPISTATNTAGKTIRFGADCGRPLSGYPHISIAITPDGKTVYAACENAVIPISTATNTSGKPIAVPHGDPDAIAITPSLSAAGGGLRQRAADQDPGQVFPVGGAGVDVGHRVRPLGRVRRGLLRARPAGQRLLHRGGPHRGGRHVDQRHPVPLQRHPDDRPVDGALGELLERPARRERLGYPDLGEQFARLQRGLEQPEEELARRDLPAPGRPPDDQRGVQRQDHGGQVGRRVTVRERPADRAPVPHLRVADAPGGVRQQRQFARRGARSASRS